MRLPGFVYHALIRALGALPLPWRRLLGRLLGRLLACLPFREQRVARLQMEFFLSQEGGSRNLGAMFAGLGQAFMESINMSPIMKRSSEYVQCRQPELFVDLCSNRRPAVILTAHTGNWELGAAYAAQQGLKLTVIGQEARVSALQKELERVRADCGLKTIWRTHALGVRQIAAELRSGRSIGAPIDQDTDVGSIFVPFFGLSAKTPMALAALAKRFDARLFSAFVVRQLDGRFSIELAEFDTELPVPEILAEYNRRLEALIREHPDQWVWVHKRWRSREDGTKLSSFEYCNWLRERLTAQRVS